VALVHRVLPSVGGPAPDLGRGASGPLGQPPGVGVAGGVAAGGGTHRMTGSAA
jgi:hypothetical protein